MAELKPQPFESYHEWKLRKSKEWASHLDLSERRTIRDFLTRIALYKEEVKAEKRSKS